MLAVPVILLGFDGFFVRFHEVFFAGDTWRFNNADTLIRIYPEQFWQDVSRLAAAIAVAAGARARAARLVVAPARRGEGSA